MSLSAKSADIMHNLAKDIKEGKIDAFDIFFKAEHNNLLFFVDSYLKERALSQDVVQESFIALWKKRESIDENRNIRTFVYTIAKNKTINVLKSKYYKVNKLNAVEIKAEIAAISSDYVTSRIDALKLEELIAKTYENLSNTVKTSFDLSVNHGLSNKEIAQKLGVTTRAVEYHISKSLKIFREKLKDYL